MNPENQGNGPDSSSNILIKRKRGRPRKDHSQNPGRIADVLTIRGPIQGPQEHAPVPPGFARANGNHSHQENAVDHNDEAMVGQRVTGVIEATFDAGYLLSVRVGNSETNLRGIVFKPGYYVPVSSENDVAPHIQMIRRNVVPFPVGHHTPVHGSYRRGRGRGRARSESRFAYSGSSTGNQLQIVPAQPNTLIGDRGTVVPVVLQPANLSNGAAPSIETPPVVSQPAHLTAALPSIETPPAVSQPAHLAASKARQVNQTQTSQTEKDLETDSGSKVKLPGGLKEESAAEVVEGIQGSSVSKETQNESTRSSGAFTAEQMQDLSQPLMVEPLQAIRSDPFNHSPSISQNFRDARAGKMTELLMAVQENLISKQATDMQHHEN